MTAGQELLRVGGCGLGNPCEEKQSHTHTCYTCHTLTLTPVTRTLMLKAQDRLL